jgi:hypothetical protein
MQVLFGTRMKCNVNAFYCKISYPSFVICSREESEGGAYPCQASSATYYAVVAVVFYVFTIFFYCLSPHKPKPLCIRIRESNKNEHDPCLCCETKKDKAKEEEKDEEKAEKEPPAEEPSNAAVLGVAAGTGAAAMANMADEERRPVQVEYYEERRPVQVEYYKERPPAQVEYYKDDMSDDKSSIGVLTVPFYRSADVLEGDLFFDANTVA